MGCSTIAGHLACEGFELAGRPFGELITLVWETHTIYFDKCCTKNAGTQKRCDILGQDGEGLREEVAFEQNLRT